MDEEEMKFSPHTPRRLWMLLSDVHFKHRDIDRIKKTAQWIEQIPSEYNIQRVVVCGDLLTTRTSQPTHVLDACYRFIGQLSKSVPHINILLGNHDLAYKNDYATTALSALGIGRLSPFVTLHSGVASQEWDGRRVLVLPFRENQNELLNAVNALHPDEAADTIAFGHLAIHKAVTQRHVLDPTTGKHRFPMTYRGLTGRNGFKSLARTYTGHFHAHQTILQTPSQGLQGSITYIGSPLQLTWADLDDDRRGVMLLDPDTLEHEFLQNPDAVGYIMANVHQVLDKTVDTEAIRNKHVMLVGELNQFKYMYARDSLLSSGARSVRAWRQLNTVSSAHIGGLGSTAPASDIAAIQNPTPATEEDKDDRNQETKPLDLDTESGEDVPRLTEKFEPAFELPALNLLIMAEDYADSLEIDPSHEQQRDLYKSVGRRLVHTATQAANGYSIDDVGYKTLLDDASCDFHAEPTSEALSQRVFVAKPRSLTISNFLGVQGTLHLDFEKDLPHGLTFMVGANGSGKSTLIEAIVWCQFGRCIRSGMGVKDVVNDEHGKDCRVSLHFENGYTITRYRKHGANGNRVVVALDGQELTEYEKPDLRETQAAIDELLGIKYDMFVRTVVLSHESAAGFLSSTPTQRRELVESLLGLSVLDRCSELARKLFMEVDKEASNLLGRLQGKEQVMKHVEKRIRELTDVWARIEEEMSRATEKLAAAGKAVLAHKSEQDDGSLESHTVNAIAEIRTKERAAYEEVAKLAELSKIVPIRTMIDTETDRIHHRLHQLERTRSSQEFSLEKLEADIEATRKTFASGLLPWCLRAMKNAILGARDICDPKFAKPKAKTIDSILESLVAPLNAMVAALGRLHSKAILQRIRRSTRMTEWLADKKMLQDEISKTEIESHRLRDDSKHVSRIIAQKLDRPIDEVQRAESTLSAEEARSVQTQLAEALQMHKSLQNDHSRVVEERKLKFRQYARKLRVLEEHQQLLQSKVNEKQNGLATYTQIIKKERSTLKDIRSEHRNLLAEADVMGDHLEVFRLWESAFSKRKTNAITLRGVVLENRLSELNSLAVQITASLYEDSRHVRSAATGMLRSIFPDQQGEELSTEASTHENNHSVKRLLDGTLNVDTDLAYAKRSGGERKRIDLAIFFALVRLAQANCAHRAHYMLVDEVFDSLDAAGRSSVTKWCEDLAGNLGFVLIVTHSEHLVSQAMDTADESEVGAAPSSVMTARVEDGNVVWSIGERQFKGLK